MDDNPEDGGLLPNKIKGIIFDKDGVITDTIPFYYKIIRTIYADHGKTIDYELFYKECIMDMKDSYLIFGADKQGLTRKEYYEKIMFYYRKFFTTDFRLIKDAKETLENLSESFLLGLATGNDRVVVDHELKSMGLNPFFKFSITGDEVERSKPDPEMFEKMVEKLKIKKNECIIIEDSVAGLKAALSAGIKCIILKNDDNIKYFNKSLMEKSLIEKTLFIDDLSKLTLDFICGLGE
jgi:putative hydrolase of the HAD superfamily